MLEAARTSGIKAHAVEAPSWHVRATPATGGTVRTGRRTSRDVAVLLTCSVALLLVAAATAGPASAAAAPRCYGAYATHWGGPGNDEIHGSPGNDVIVGLGGSDRLFGEGGNDIICGGPGHDLLEGGPGNDLIAGNDGADRLSGDAGNDRLRGFAGNDVIWGGAGDDSLEGGDGHDWKANWGNDVLIGDTGNDIMKGSAGNDQINSFTTDNPKAIDKLYGWGGNDKLYANDHAPGDVVSGGEGAGDLCLADPGDHRFGCEVNNAH